MKRTAAEWAQLDKEYVIKDHDGWRDAPKTPDNLGGFNVDFFTRKIGENEYIRRRMRCSCERKEKSPSNASKDRIVSTGDVDAQSR